MKLRYHDGGSEIVSVHEVRTGRRFDIMQLDADDFDELSTLTPKQLSDWLEMWRLGFRRGLRG